jgi:type IV pilus assembly protein PilM
VTYGVLKGIPSASEYDPENPPPSVVVISMGTDTTDLVVTNGFRIWQRSIPIGGSHFTKQLTKEMKLTFAKAEQLKRNARQSEDPKAVFQAMRPVFNDLVQELQRSIGYFRSIDREAKIEAGVVLGNAMRLPGLQPYVEKNLGIPIKKVSEFRHLSGANVLSTPKYKDNLLSFAVSYGLCIQGVKKGRLSTNLIPRELITARLIRRKKPWALVGLAVLLLSIAFNYLFQWNRWRDAHEDRYREVKTLVDGVAVKSSSYLERDKQLQEDFDKLKQLGNEVVGGADARFLVLEMLKAFNTALPREEGADPTQISKTPYLKRPELHIEYGDSQYFPELTDYFKTDVEQRYEQFLKDLAYAQKREASGASPGAEAAPADETETDSVDSELAEDELDDESDTEEDSGFVMPTLPDFARPGWVMEIRGFHFHNDDIYNRESQYLVNTILANLENGTVDLPAGPGKPLTTFTMKELGIYCPILASEGREVDVAVPNPNYKPPEGGVRPGGEQFNSNQPRNTDPANAEFITVTAHEFTIHFIWIETRASERLEARKQKQLEADAPSDENGGGF